MVIDFHTHTFPEKIANAALNKLSDSSGISYYLDGTLKGLIESMQKSGVTHSVVLPVVTNPAQFEAINTTAIKINEKYADDGIISFGGIHPDNDNYREKIKWLSNNGFKGLKFHPVFQETFFDDIKYKRIIDCACEHGLIMVVHGGFDISFPEDDYVTPRHILPVLEELKPKNLIFAHMGAWNCWDEMIPILSEYKVKMDTSFSITPSRDNKTGEFDTNCPVLPKDDFVKMVRLTGAKNVVFGSDSPWTMHTESIEAIKNSGLTADEQELILYKNAKRLLGI